MIGLMAALAAQAVFVSGNELYENCVGDVDHQIWCLQYVTGAVDGATMMGVADGRESVCVPTSVSRRQLMDIVVKYLKDNPGSRNLNAGGITIVAIRSAFPC